MAKPTAPTKPEAAKTAGPGRPKDLGKRAAILAAAKRLFVQQGFEGVSMDQIAGEAGVSKLTVYSHFGDKEGLFAEAVRAHCEDNMPTALFEPEPDVPLRERLSDIGRGFFAMIMTPEAIAGHRILCTPQMTGSDMQELFWKAGPQRTQMAFVNLLQRRIEAGELDIDDPERAAAHFFTLLKGELHALAVFGYSCSKCDTNPVTHVTSVVDLFLRAYAKR